MVLQPDQAVIGSRDKLGYWLEKLQHGPLAIDTETTGLDWMEDRVGGLCLAAGRTAIYTYGDALGPSVKWLADQIRNGRQLIFHNAKFDLHMLRAHFGLVISRPVEDTMVMSFLLDNRGAPNLSYEGDDEYSLAAYSGNGLKPLAAAFVDPRAREPEDDLRDAVIAAGGKRGKETWKSDILLAPPHLVGKYGLMDAWYTLRLFHQFEDRIRHWIQPPGDYPSLWSLYDTERWVTLALMEMEHFGVRANPEFFDEWRKELEVKRKKILRKLEKIAKKEINWNSTPQLRTLLYEDLGLPIQRWTKGGKKAGPQPSTDEVALLDLEHPIGAILLQLRDCDKQLTTYARGLLNAVRPNGRIHTTFRQIGARTGRLSSANPNLQQVPRESGARRGFEVDDGLLFRFADYSQAEMRFAAHSSGDPMLVGGFRDDPNFDTHAATAKKMWGLSGAPSKRQRKFAKILNFAMLYGAGENNVTQSLISLLTADEAFDGIRSFGYRPSPGELPHRTLAILLRKRYFEELPSVRRTKNSVTEETKRLGFTMNFYGRHRYLGPREAYKAFNTEIQGSAVDLSKAGLVKVYREMQLNRCAIRLQLQIHDEIVYQTDGDPRTDRMVLELMDDRDTFKVPIIADVNGSKTNWQEKVELEL